MTIAWPASVLPTLPLRWQYVTNSVSTQSPFTKARRDEERIGAHWRVSAHFGPLYLAEARVLSSFLMALDGTVGRCVVPDWSYAGKQGGATGTITLTGNKDGKTATLAGVGGTGPHFLAGDRIEVGERLYQIVADFTASGGAGTVQLRPPLRQAHAAAAVEYQAPGCLMMLADDLQVALDALGGPIREATITMIEPLP